MNIKQLTAVLFLIFCLAGCTYMSQDVKLAPSLAVENSDIGKGQKISIQVVDERDDRVIGQRSNGEIMGGRIQCFQDLPTLLLPKIEEGFKSKGFELSAQSETSVRNVKVEIRLLSYSTAVGLVTADVHAKTTLKIIASNGNKTSEKFYRSDISEGTLIVPTAKSNENQINQSLNDALKQIFADEDLMRFLAS